MVFHIFVLPQWYYRIFTHWECYTLNKERTWFLSFLYLIFTQLPINLLGLLTILSSAKTAKEKQNSRPRSEDGDVQQRGGLAGQGRWRGILCYKRTPQRPLNFSCWVLWGESWWVNGMWQVEKCRSDIKRSQIQQSEARVVKGNGDGRMWASTWNLALSSTDN